MSLDTLSVCLKIIREISVIDCKWNVLNWRNHSRLLACCLLPLHRYMSHFSFSFHFFPSSNLVTVLDTLDVSKLKPFPKGQPEKFAKFLDETVGYR